MGRILEGSELLGNAVATGSANVNLGKVCSFFFRVGFLSARQTSPDNDRSFKPSG